MISIIVAVAENGTIGDKNSLLWHISEDLKHFKAHTSGHPVIMGRKTFESLGRPLPNLRLNPEVRSIFDFRYEDFELIGYDPHPAIKGEMSF